MQHVPDALTLEQAKLSLYLNCGLFTHMPAKGKKSSRFEN